MSEHPDLAGLFHSLSPDAQAAALVYGVVDPHVRTTWQAALILRQADIQSQGRHLTSSGEAGLGGESRIGGEGGVGVGGGGGGGVEGRADDREHATSQVEEPGTHTGGVTGRIEGVRYAVGSREFVARICIQRMGAGLDAWGSRAD